MTDEVPVKKGPFKPEGTPKEAMTGVTGDMRTHARSRAMMNSRLKTTCGAMPFVMDLTDDGHQL